MSWLSKAINKATGMSATQVVALGAGAATGNPALGAAVAAGIGKAQAANTAEENAQATQAGAASRATQANGGAVNTPSEDRVSPVRAPANSAPSSGLRVDYLLAGVLAMLLLVQFMGKGRR